MTGAMTGARLTNGAEAPQVMAEGAPPWARKERGSGQFETGGMRHARTGTSGEVNQIGHRGAKVVARKPVARVARRVHHLLHHLIRSGVRQRASHLSLRLNSCWALSARVAKRASPSRIIMKR